jgi:uncharacterized membrane protein YgcG
MAVMDDYQDEMSSLSSADIEAVLSGSEPESPAAVASSRAVADIRRALVRPIAPDVASAHLAAMAQAMAPAGKLTLVFSAAQRRNSMRTKTRRRAGIIALAAALVTGGGLAAAVTLPGQANDHATQHVTTPDHPAGLGLPSDSEHGQTVSDFARNTSLIGCEKGQAIADLASALSLAHRQDAADRPDPCTASEGSEAGGGGSASGSGSGSGGPGGGGGSGGGSGVGGGGSGGGSGGPGGGSGSGSGGPSGDVPTP